jgi:hypothetical protein
MKVVNSSAVTDRGSKGRKGSGATGLETPRGFGAFDTNMRQTPYDEFNDGKSHAKRRFSVN